MAILCALFLITVFKYAQKNAIPEGVKLRESCSFPRLYSLARILLYTLAFRRNCDYVFVNVLRLIGAGIKFPALFLL